MVDASYSPAILGYIFEMYKDIRKTAMKVEFIRHNHACVHSAEDRWFEYLAMNYFVEFASKSGCTDCTDEMVSTASKDFFDKIYKKSEAEKTEPHANEIAASAKHADRIFIMFVRMFLRAATKTGELEEWSSERIARGVLGCMHDYYAHDWEWKKEPAEYFFGRLVKGL